MRVVYVYAELFKGDLSGRHYTKAKTARELAYLGQQFQLLLLHKRSSSRTSR